MAIGTERPSPMEKWVVLLEAFVEQAEWGVRDLGRRTGLPRSAVHRMLHEMARVGMLSETAEPGRFQVGPTLVRLSTMLTDRFDLKRIARPVLEETHRLCQETVVLTLYSPTRRQFCALDAAESQQAVRYMWETLKDWSNLHMGSSGKGILAFLPAAEQAAILEELPDPVPGLHPISRAEFARQLSEAHARGYVVSRGERYSGAMGAAAPIYDALGRVTGSVIVTAPEVRMGIRTDAEWGELAMQAAGQIAQGLGYRPEA